MPVNFRKYGNCWIFR